MMNYIKKYLKDKTVPFYIGLAMALLSLITAIIYGAGLAFLSEYINHWVTALLVVGPIIFISLTFIKCNKIGLFLFAISNAASFILFILSIYSYPVNEIMSTPNVFDLPGFALIIIVALFLIIILITSNVLVWLKLNKEVKTND